MDHNALGGCARAPPGQTAQHPLASPTASPSALPENPGLQGDYLLLGQQSPLSRIVPRHRPLYCPLRRPVASGGNPFCCLVICFDHISQLPPRQQSTTNNRRGQRTILYRLSHSQGAL